MLEALDSWQAQSTGIQKHTHAYAPQSQASYDPKVKFWQVKLLFCGRGIK